MSQKQGIKHEYDVFNESIEHFRANLHDYVNILIPVRNIAEGLAYGLEKEGSPHANKVYEISKLLTELASSLGTLMINMRMPLLGDQQLGEALLEFLKFFGKEIALSLDINKAISLSPKTSEAFFIISREGIANAVRHGKAKNISVKIDVSDSESNLTITDDGSGFDQETTKFGSGLYYMSKISDSLGGTLRILSQLNKGTTLIVNIPAN